MEDLLKHIDEELVKQIAFFFIASITIGGAVYLLFTRNVLYAAFSLLVTLLGMAGLYVFAGADFLAVSQIMIYVGGILILMIFGIMLTNKTKDKQAADKVNTILVSHHNRFWGVLVAGLLFLGFLKVIFTANFHLITRQTIQGTTVNKIGVELMTNYVLAFELIGLLLLATLVGAAYVAKKDKV
ncbi:NADH-quinone oxidoreductase subunit J [Emticicia sp. TH156]|uniref:NADH-quinone oxidoreductase subunit J family protein n=1 Tax=Emticicia sp. TH156 TaxID=2067454 RepID=UPI001E3CD424|nr:NADH-quinone oxidoreductase subunit J [Emticicia sp. TH156]